MSYKVSVTREDEYWLADVPELEGGHTYAPTLNGLRQAVREVIVVAADLPDDAQPDFVFTFDDADEDIRSSAETARWRAEIKI